MLCVMPKTPLTATSDCAAEYSPFFGIEKGAVLQEARVFNESHLNARQCQQVTGTLILPRCVCHYPSSIRFKHLCRSLPSCCTCFAKERPSAR